MYEKSEGDNAVISHELQGRQYYEMGQDEHALELQAGKDAQELGAQERRHELEGTPVR